MKTLFPGRADLSSVRRLGDDQSARWGHARPTRFRGKRNITRTLSTLVGGLLLAHPAWLQGADRGPRPDLVAAKARFFDLKQVRLLDGPFRDAMLRNERYLLRLEPDRFLHTFRLNVGLPSSARPYGGWEEPKCELRGHSLGHYLSALAMAHASSGDPAFGERAKEIVAELAKCQAASPKAGFHAGYLSAFPESFLDRVEARQPVWAPWYTLHKIMAGLLDVHQLCDNPPALEVLVKMADWVKFRVDRLTLEQMQASLDAEFGGMNEVLANLYAVTGNPDHLRLAKAFDHQRVFDPLARGEDRLNGLHANTQIPKMIGAAREYELTGDPRYRQIAQCFWERVAEHRSYVIGGHSDSEHFFPIEEFARHLSTDTAETCNTYNLLKLTRHLFAWEPSVRTMDFYERGLYNHIFASQDPEQGMFVYLMSLKPGHFKTYSRPEDSFWCCVGTGMENHVKYADTIYGHDAGSLYVNLFIASELNWTERGVKVRQETQFPESDLTRLSFECATPVEFTLKVRRPGWAGKGFAVRVNGRKQKIVGEPGSYVAFTHRWKTGDRVEIDLPMELRTEALPGNPDTVAVLWGPVVLAGELGRDGMPSPYARGQSDLNSVPSPEVPVFVGDPGEVRSHFRPVEGRPVTFQTKGLGRPRDVTLIPFYRLHHQRYSVYWKVFTEAGWKAKQAELAAAEAKRKEVERRTVDVVRPGEQQSETDHKLAGEHTQSGDLFDRKWRHATDGGWFSWELKVLPGEPQNLAVTYWGSDSGNRVFDVLLDGTRVATQRLENNRAGEFHEEVYRIPAELTKGKERVGVKFQAQPGAWAGGIFGVRVLRPAP